jgi:hypothetical protein
VDVFEGWPRQLPGADPAAFFRWKHLESPFGPSVMVVAEADGAVIGRGVAGALIRAATASIADGYAFAFSNPNGMSDPMLVKLGRRPVGPFEVLVRPRWAISAPRAAAAPRQPARPRHRPRPDGHRVVGPLLRGSRVALSGGPPGGPLVFLDP